MEKIYESRFMKGLQNFGIKLSNSKAFSSISKAMMTTMSIILVGAIFQIVATLPTVFKWTTTESAFYQWLMVPYNMTMGMVSLIIAFSLGYNYAKALDMKPLMNGIVSVLMFLLVAAPAKTVALANNAGTLAALDTSNLGAQGLFVAIIIGIFSVKITRFCEKRHIVIKMPDVVPPFLADSFNVLIPLLLNILIWHGINSLISSAMGVTLPMAIAGILSVPLKALNSVPGMIIISLFATLLWTFGIHGTMVAYIAIVAVMIQNISANAAAVAAGQPPVFYASMLFGAVACCGGTGCTFGLVLLGLRSKSEQMKAISKASLIPGLFGINEPVAFGYPIMYNPILAIPYILTPIVGMALMYIGFMTGFLKPSYILIMSLMPMGVGEFLGTMSWTNALFPFLMIPVSMLINYPFYKAYEHQLVDKEAAARAEAAVAEA